MRFLLTGGTGFIGSELARTLAEKHEVTLLSRAPSNMPGSNLTPLAWDAKTPGPWTNVINQTDCIINLAGESVVQKRWTPAQKQKILESRLSVTRLLVNAVQNSKNKPALLINGSAVGYYSQEGNQPITESSAKGSGFLSDVCSAWEQEALHAVSPQTRTVLLRIGIVLGPSGGILKRLMPLFSAGLGACPGTGAQWIPWIHQKELAPIVQFLCDHPGISGPVNTVSPNPVAMKELTGRLAFHLKRPCLFRIPEGIIRFSMGELSEMILASQRVIPSKLLKNHYPFRYPTIDSAFTEILGQKS